MIPPRELDTNINILHALLRPGERLSTKSIGDIVGCSQQNVYLIEKKALKKVRERLRKKLEMDRGQFVQSKVSDLL